MQQARETLGNMPHAMLRQGDWFNVSTGDDELDEDPQNMKWSEDTKERMRDFIYRPKANFVKATIEGDHDWVSVGNPILSVEENKDRDGILYRAWHPRDNAWMMDADGQIDHNQRKFEMTARNVVKRWKNVNTAIKNAAEKDPNKPIKLRHILMPTDDIYGDDKASKRRMRGMKFVSLYIDDEHEEVLGDSGSPVFNYVIPRWRTLSHFPIGFSPATINCLPDGRMLQTMARIILEQGERAVDPPTVAKGNIFRDEINLYAGGQTYVDLEPEEKLGDVFQVLSETGNMQVGLEMRQDTRNLIAESFLLNKLMLPTVHEMTAFETQARLDEFRRAALPFFGPIEAEYHMPLLNVTFDLLLHAKQIPVPPKALQEMDLTFKFEGPLNTLEGRQTVAAFQESVQIIAAAVQATGDQTILTEFDMKHATKDAVRGAGGKPEWFVDPETLKQSQEQQSQTGSLVQAASIANAAGMATQNVGKGIKALQEAGAV
jgi:hypothetical protein